MIGWPWHDTVFLWKTYIENYPYIYILYILDVHTYNGAFNLQSSETSVKTRDNLCVSGDDVVARIMFLGFAGGHKLAPDPQRPKVTSESQKCPGVEQLTPEKWWLESSKPRFRFGILPIVRGYVKLQGYSKLSQQK